MDKERLIDILGGLVPNEKDLLFFKTNSVPDTRTFYRGIPLHYSLIKKGQILKEFSHITHWTDDKDIAMWYADIDSSNEGCPDMNLVKELKIADKDISNEFKPFIMVADNLTGFDAHDYLSDIENPFSKEREFITVGKKYKIGTVTTSFINNKLYYFGIVKECL